MRTFMQWVSKCFEDYQDYLWIDPIHQSAFKEIRVNKKSKYINSKNEAIRINSKINRGHCNQQPGCL